MNPGVLLFVVLLLIILFVFILLDNRKKKPVKKLTWVQRGRLKHKATKKMRKRK